MNIKEVSLYSDGLKASIEELALYAQNTGHVPDFEVRAIAAEDENMNTHVLLTMVTK